MTREERRMSAAARLREALTEGRWATIACRSAAAALEAGFPGARKLTPVAWSFHRDAAEWAVTETRHAPPAEAVIFTASGLAPGDPPMHAAAAGAAPRARFCYVDGDRRAVLLNRARLALADPVRVLAAEADEENPEAVLTAAAGAGLPVGGPVSVHIVVAPTYWPGDVARKVLAGYVAGRRRLAPGSSVCVSVCTAAEEGPRGDEFLAALSRAAGVRAYPHTRDRIASWFEDAGMILHPQGVTDARAFGRPEMQAEIEGLCPFARITEAVGIVPWQP